MEKEDIQRILKNAFQAANDKKIDAAVEYLEIILQSEDCNEKELVEAVNISKSIGKKELSLSLALKDTNAYAKSLNLKACQLLEEHPPDDWTTLKIGILGNCTFSTLEHPIRLGLARGHFLADFFWGNFNVVNQELINQDSELFKCKPDFVVVINDQHGLLGTSSIKEEKERAQMFLSEIEQLLDSIQSWFENTGCPVIINSIAPLRYPRLGFCDSWVPWGDRYLVDKSNLMISERVAESSGIVMVDTSEMIYELSWKEWSDPKWWFYGRIPWTDKGANALGLRIAEAMTTMKRGNKKVLALDLDNTLWNGILGEVGVTGVGVGDDYPGNAFKAFQAECLRLKLQGMLLVILSKNEEDAALEVFKKHPGMLIRMEDIVAHRINWEPKPEGLVSLAKELNLGTDSFIFLDDSPHERGLMRAMLPEVTVPPLPNDVSLRPSFLRSLTCAWPVRLTSEDAKRSQIYKEQAQRKQLKMSTRSLEDYLLGLDQQIIVGRCTQAQIARTVQLHQRTNQFNLTTLRLDEGDITRMVEDNNSLVLVGHVKDRFGDQGQVLVSTVKTDGKMAEILSFLMSCRTIGRNVEFAFFSYVTKMLKKQGIKKIKAAYSPTPKNRQVKDLWDRFGFNKVREDEKGNTHWEMDLDEPFPCPQYIKMVTNDV